MIVLEDAVPGRTAERVDGAQPVIDLAQSEIDPRIGQPDGQRRQRRLRNVGKLLGDARIFLLLDGADCQSQAANRVAAVQLHHLLRGVEGVAEVAAG